MKNFFLQKISLLLMVLLTLSGCELDFSQRWAFQYSPESKTYLEYFHVGDYYGDDGEYLYTIKNSISYLGSHKFDEGSVTMLGTTMTGTFGKLDDGYGTVLTATVNTSSEVITITSTTVEKPYIAYFKDFSTYGGVKNDIYTYDMSTKSLNIYTNDVRYVHVRSSGNTGTFSDGVTTLTATVNADESITITGIPFLDYFINSNTYGPYNMYEYHASDNSLNNIYNGVKYAYDVNGNMTTGIGTFSSSAGASLTATVNADESITLY